MTDETAFSVFSGKRVLVTGGTGLIGRQVGDILAHAGAKLRIVSLDRLKLDIDAEYIVGDLTDICFCRSIMDGIDYVAHLAGVGASVAAAVSKRASHFVPTLMMNTNLLEAAREHGVVNLVYTSSIGAYAPGSVFREDDYRIDSAPMDFAGWAKRMAEAQLDAYRSQYGLSYACVRPANVYGPGDNFDPANALVVPSLLSRIKRGDDPVVIWGDGSAIRDFVFSRDVAEGILLALAKGTGDGFVNLGSGIGYSIRELVETLAGFIDFRFVFDPSKPSGYPKRVLDIAKARALIGYEPRTTLAEGLKQTWEWYCGHGDEYLQKMNYFKD